MKFVFFIFLFSLVANAGFISTFGSGGGGGSPAGSSGDIQYNSSGAFGADSNFTRNPSTLVTNINIVDGSNNFAGIGLVSDLDLVGPGVKLQAYSNTGPTDGMALNVTSDFISISTLETPNPFVILQAFPISPGSSGWLSLMGGEQQNSEGVAIGTDASSSSIAAFGSGMSYSGKNYSELNLNGLFINSTSGSGNYQVGNPNGYLDFIYNNSTILMRLNGSGGYTVQFPGLASANYLYTNSSGDVQAGFNAIPSPTSGSTVASVNGSFTIGNFVSAHDNSGTIQDSGYGASSFLQPGASYTNISGLGSLATQNTVSTAQITGLGTAATLNATYTGSGNVAGTSGSFTGNNVLVSADSSGTVSDGGVNIGNLITNANFGTTLSSTSPISSGISGTFAISTSLGGSVSMINGVIQSWTPAP